MTQNDSVVQMPYVRNIGHCDICGVRVGNALQRVELEPHRPATEDRPARAARVIYVCLRHARREGHTAPPHSELAAGTSRLRPQRETLFDPAPHGCATECRYPAICPPCVHANTAEKLAANDAAGLRDGRIA